MKTRLLSAGLLPTPGDYLAPAADYTWGVSVVGNRLSVSPREDKLLCFEGRE